MKKNISIGLYLLLVSIFAFKSQAQSIKKLFFALPSYCTPSLNSEGRKMLLKDTEYTVLGNTERDNIDYTIDTVESNYISYEFSANNGKGTNENYEIKKFKLTNGKYILVYSQDADPRNASRKYVLKVFDISGNKLTV